MCFINLYYSMVYFMLIINKELMIWGDRVLYYISGLTLLGYIGFGVIDRGTNVLQVRPTTLCPLNCIFCSVDAGPYSRNRWAEYIVDYESLIHVVGEVARFKGIGVEALIDTIGDPFTYPRLVELVENLKKIPYVKTVAVETHGELLNREIINKLEKAGLDRINLSIDTLNPEKARFLQGVKWYNVSKVKELAEYIAKNTSIDLHVTPVWIPGINDKDVIEVVEWAYRIGAGKKWPPATIQKYNVHKYGRKVPGIKPLSWNEFWRKLREFEEETGLRVSWSMDEWGMRRTKRYPCPYKRGDTVMVEIVSRGVFRGEYIGVTTRKNWLVTIPSKRNIIGETIAARIIQDKDCLLIAKPIGKI